jgi:hypothetical protein
VRIERRQSHPTNAGRKIRVLAAVDNFTRQSPAIDVRLSYRGADVVSTLEGVSRTYGRVISREIVLRR